MAIFTTILCDLVSTWFSLDYFFHIEMKTCLSPDYIVLEIGVFVSEFETTPVLITFRNEEFQEYCISI